ncbi:MAG: NAD(P)/FAD-dependent oxidoreductase [Thermosynechococcaceae cyanobacterium MS004]|nr:NAD(P)/FAD-dependent oxidoreductase [Thermosynechococcaceae cyanobacterium MS004]
MKVVVIGGGAAGFFGAIACAESNPHGSVLLLEASPQVLSKVRISGGGRCNVTHACFEPTALVQYYPRGSKALRGPLSQFQPKDTIDWFAQRGVELKTEKDGRMFPVTDSSETIVNCLVSAARAAGVEVWTGAAVTQISVDGASRFRVQVKSRSVDSSGIQETGIQDTGIQETGMNCDRLLLATGSHPLGYRLAASLGHPMMSPVPSLFTFNLSDPRLQGLAGVSVGAVKLQLLVENQKPLEQTGPLLITHWGISGPAVLKLSAWGARILHETRYRATLQINWVPDLTAEALRSRLVQAKVDVPKRAVLTHSPAALPQRLWQRLVSAAGISAELRWGDLSKQGLNRLLLELQQGRFEIQGKGVFKDEFVTCGGIDLKAVNFKTMESRSCPGLFFAGEILDIDGVTGGFNFQNAWTTGWIAGQAIVKSIIQ